MVEMTFFLKIFLVTILCFCWISCSDAVRNHSSHDVPFIGIGTNDKVRTVPWSMSNRNIDALAGSSTSFFKSTSAVVLAELEKRDMMKSDLLSINSSVTSLSTASAFSGDKTNQIEENKVVEVGEVWKIRYLVADFLGTHGTMFGSAVRADGNLFFGSSASGGQLHWDTSKDYHWYGYTKAAPQWQTFSAAPNTGFVFRTVDDGPILSLKGSEGINRDTGGKRVEVGGFLSVSKNRVHFDRDKQENFWFGFKTGEFFDYLTFSSVDGFRLRNDVDGDLVKLYYDNRPDGTNLVPWVDFGNQLFVGADSGGDTLHFDGAVWTESNFGYSSKRPGWMTFTGNSAGGVALSNSVDGKLFRVHGSGSKDDVEDGVGLTVAGTVEYNGSVFVDGTCYVKNGNILAKIDNQKQRNNDLRLRIMKTEKKLEEIQEMLLTLTI